jgi:AraC-like DNA-binding protein
MRCGPEHSVERLTTVIASLAEKGSGIDSRARWIAGHDPLLPARIETIASELGIPDRSLRAWSAAHLGMPIKSFFKIRRLHGALSMRIGSDAATWSQIAATAGYSDQSHLIRDCRTLLGESPGSFMARAS